MISLKARLEKISVRHVLALLLIITIAISVQCYLTSFGKKYTRYNNYVIFTCSFNHLVNHENLYLEYPKEYGDLYKYSPTFALFMGLFKPMPDLLGLFIFNLLNVTVLVYALSKLNFPQKRYTFLLLFLVVETGISLSSSQTNLLMAGLIILSFVAFEKKNIALASLFICLTFFIKIFGIVAFALWLLYPQKGKFILYTLLWMTLLLMIPALVISPTELMWQYENWMVLLQQDHSASVGISFMGWMYSWFGWNLPKIGTLVVAAALFLLPFLKTKQYGDYLFRIQMVASVLLWIVIFNHKGESPTYIIAMAGVALWYYSQKRISVNLVLLWLCLVFTSFSSTEAFTPLWVTSRYVVPFSIKAVFCTIIWCKLIFDVMLQKSTPDPELALSEKLG